MGQIAGIGLVWFIIEMLIWYGIAQYTSGWYVFFWFILAAIIGMTFMRKGMSTLSPLANQMKTGGMMPGMQPNEDSMMKNVSKAVAGILLFIPGVLSDVMAVLVLLPPVQKKLKAVANNYVKNNQEKMMQMMMKQMGGQMPHGMGGMGGMNGQNPFGAGSPFGNMNGGQGQSPFGSSSPFGSNTTVDGTAKTIQKDAKKLNPANDD